MAAAVADLEQVTRAELIAEVEDLRAQLADKDRLLRIARSVLDEGLSDADGAASPRPG